MRFHHHHGHRGGFAGWQAVRGLEDMLGHYGFRPFEEGRGGGRRRVFDGGELRLVLLRLIGDQPRHGYDLIRAIEERTGGAYAPSPGTVYPTLTLLADMGQIAEEASEGTRKAFGTTPEGERVLVEKADEIAAVMARLDAIGAARGRSENTAVRRAVHNLKAVLHHRLAREPDTETVHAIVALIDDAAQRIERL